MQSFTFHLLYPLLKGPGYDLGCVDLEALLGALGKNFFASWV